MAIFGSRKILNELSQCQQKLMDMEQMIGSIKDSTATIEFTPDGQIIGANHHFCSVMGYDHSQLVGNHHRIFCLPAYASSREYQEFWASLRAGNPFEGRVERINSKGDIYWLACVYFPIKNSSGHVNRVFKAAFDVTQAHQDLLHQSAILKVLYNSLAVIEFTPTGVVKKANQLFLDAMGYSMSQVLNQHHRMFCDEAFYSENPHFWQEIKSGQVKSGKFMRYTASGQVIWLNATYSPVYNARGEVEMVVKFASDITVSELANRETFETAQIAANSAKDTLVKTEDGRGLLQTAIKNSEDIAGQVSAASRMVSDLNEHSKKIESIVSTITGIAEQTNLLALNAAIEAARAGEQGRGFAVVADEVRQLAARTSQSTGQIAEVVKENRELTDKVTEKMAEGAKAAEAGKLQISQLDAVMNSIYEGAESVSDRISRLQQVQN